MLVQHHSQRIHHVAATYPSTAEPRKYLPQSRKTSVIVPIRRPRSRTSTACSARSLQPRRSPRMSGCGIRISGTTASTSARYARSCTPCRRPGNSTCRDRLTHRNVSISWTRGHCRPEGRPARPTPLPRRPPTDRARRQQDHGAPVSAGRRDHRRLGGRQSRSGHRPDSEPADRDTAHHPDGMSHLDRRLGQRPGSTGVPQGPPTGRRFHPQPIGFARRRLLAVRRPR